MGIEKNKSFREHLNIIRTRPATILGEKSIKALDVYLSGYLQCATMHSISRPFTDFPEFADFNAFVKKKFNEQNSTLNGLYVLFYHSHEREEEAFNAYFELLDEFVGMNHCIK